MENTQTCLKCGQIKDIRSFYFLKSKNRHLRKCAECVSEYKREYHKLNPRKAKEARIRYREKDKERFLSLCRASNKRKDVRHSLINHAKMRSRDNNIPFNITRHDITIPEFCPVLGIKIIQKGGKTSDNSPSIDRIIPELGYIKGNVMVISWRANSIKRDGTAEDHDKIAKYIRDNDMRSK